MPTPASRNNASNMATVTISKEQYEKLMEGASKVPAVAMWGVTVMEQRDALEKENKNLKNIIKDMGGLDSDEEEYDVCCVGCQERVCGFHEEPPHKDHRGEAVCEECWNATSDDEEQEAVKNWDDRGVECWQCKVCDMWNDWAEPCWNKCGKVKFGNLRAQ